MGNFLARINKGRQRLKNITNVFEGKEPRVLILGLDGSGKTTLLYKSKLDDAIFANMPPRGINIELMTPRRGARLQVFDMPGSKLTRYVWENWFKCTEAIVYVVDSTDRVRIDEAKFELHDLLQSRDLRRVPLVVVANKQDKDDAMCVDVVSAELELTSIQNRDWSIHSTCANKGTGIKKVFQDVVDKIKAFRHYKSSLSNPNNSNKRKTEEKSKQTINSLEFTSIEDDSKNEKANIPSLFDSIGKRADIKDTSSVRNGSSSSDSDPPEYDRPVNPEQDNTSYQNITLSNSLANEESKVDKVTELDAVVDEFDTVKDEENIKVTDIDSVSRDSVTVSASSDDESATYANYDAGNVYEFEPNAPIAVV